MTKLLKQAIAAAEKLAAAEQDALAARWLAEIANETAWDQAFANSQDKLELLAREALAEHEAGLTQDWEPK